MLNKKFCVIWLLLGLSTSSYCAANIKFNGFASIKASAVFDDETDLNGNGQIDSSESAFSGDYDNNLTFEHDSLFALQTTTDLGENLSATIQLIAEGKNSWDLEARWAFISYELSDNYTLQVGRIVLPAFYKSEFEKVGYAHNYARLPATVYDEIAFSTVDGIRLNTTHTVDELTIRSSLSYSNWDDLLTLRADKQEYPGTLEDIWGLNLEVNFRWLTLFAGGFIADADFESLDNALINPQIDQLVQAGIINAEEGMQTKESLTFSGDGQYYYLGFDIDYNDWLLTAEYTDYGIKDSGDSFNEAWYVTAGKRFDPFVLTYTHGKLEQPIDLNRVNQLPIKAQPYAYAIRSSLAEQYFTYNAISLRYDFNEQAAYKLDLFIWDPLDSGETLSGLISGIDLVF